MKERDHTTKIQPRRKVSKQIVSMPETAQSQSVLCPNFSTCRIASTVVVLLLFSFVFYFRVTLSLSISVLQSFHSLVSLLKFINLYKWCTIHTHTHTHTHTHAHTHAHTHTHIYTHAHTHTHTYACHTRAFTMSA